ncbi:hypothetical protein BGW42_005225 [Actinomortierella wolfii]|nr:hypothetical protein BGW42_005225 [Actinomortierella wolfii]
MARFQASLIPLSQIEDPPKFFESLDDQSVIHHEDDGELPAPPPPYLVSMLNAMKHSGKGVEDVVFYDGDQLHVAQLRMGKTEATTATTTAVTKGTGAEVKEDNNSSDVHCQNQEHTHTHLQQQRQPQRQQHPRTVSYQWSSRAIDDGDSSSSVVTSVENVSRPRSHSHASQHSAIDATVVQPHHTQQEQEQQQQQQQQQPKNNDPLSQKIQGAPNRMTVDATLSANLLARGNEGREDARAPQQQHLLHSPARPDSLHRSLSAGSGSSSNEWQRRPSLPQSVMDTRSSTAMLKRSTAKAYDRHSPIQSHSPQQQRSPTATVSRNSGAAGSGMNGSSVGVGSQTTQDPFLGFPYNNSSLLMAATTEAEMSGQRRKSRLSSHEGEIKPKNSTSLAARNVKKDLGTAQGNAPGPPSSQSKEGKVAQNQQQQQHCYPQTEGERPRKARIDSGHDASDTAEHGGHLENKVVAINGKNTQWTMDPEPSETVTSSPRLIESPDTASLSADGLVETPTEGEHAIYVHHTSNKNSSCSPRRRRPRPLSVPVNGLDFADLKIALGEGTPQPRGKTSTDSPIQHQEPRTPILPVDFGGFPQLNSSALMTLMDDQWSDQHKDSKRKERRKKKKGGSNGDPQRRKSRDLSLSPGLPSSDPHRHHRLHHQQPHPTDGAEYQRQRVYSQNPILSHDSLESTQIQSTCSAGTSASAATTSNINQQPLPSPSQPSAFQQISSNHSGSVRQQMLRMNKRHLIGSSSVASNRKDESFPQENSAEANEGSPRFANGYEDAVQCDSPPVVQHQQQKQRQSYVASSISSLEDTDNNREYKSLVRDGPESLDCALSDGAISVPIRPLAQGDSPVQYRHSHMPTTSHQQAPGRSGKGEPLERIPSGMVLNHKNDDRPRSSVTPIQSNIFEHGQDDRLVEMPPVRARTLASSNRVRPTSAPLGSSISDTAMQATLVGSGGDGSVASSVNAGTAGGATADTRNVSSSAPKSSMFFSNRTSSSPTKKSMHPFLGAMSLTLGARRQFFAEQKKQRNLEANEAAAAVAAVAAQASASFSTSIGSLDYVGGGDDESNHTAATGSRWYGNGGGVEGERGNGNGGVGGGVNGRAPNSSAESSGATTIGSAEQLEQQKKKRKEKFLEGLKRFLLRPTPNGGRRSVMIHDEGSTGGSGIGDMDSIAGSGDDRQWNQHHQLQHRKDPVVQFVA